MKTPGDRLRRARKIKGLTQSQLAMEAGCSRQTISNLENNQVSRPSIPEVAPVCLALGITLDWYWLGIGAPPDLSQQIMEAVEEVLAKNSRN